MFGLRSSTQLAAAVLALYFFVWSAADGKERKTEPQPSSATPSPPVGFVGLLLKSVDGHTMVDGIAPTGPAEKDGRVKVGDRIVAVAATSGEFVNVDGMPVEKVREMLSGRKGTQAKLLVLGKDAPGSQPIKIELVRDDIHPTKVAEVIARQAEKGDADAQVALALQYVLGSGVPKDYSKAVEWCQKAVAQGNAEAQAFLGSFYESGRGVPQDYSKAVELYRKAVEQGDERGHLALARLYRRGKGVPRDYQKAAELYETAAAKGDTRAQNELGWLYESGMGVTRDYAKAAELYQKAVDQGDPDAQVHLATLYADGRGVAQDYKKAADLCEKAASGGNARAQVYLAYLYAIGKGVPQDYSKAAELYRKAAAQGNVEAQVGLGSLILRKKRLGEQDYREAAALWQKAAEAGNAEAQFHLGQLYENGLGVERDARKAADFYRKSAEQQYASAQSALARLYVRGIGVLQDNVEALKWLDLAAISGEANAVDMRDALAGYMTPQAVAQAQQLAKRFLADHSPDSKEKPTDVGLVNTLTVSGTGFFITRSGYLLTNYHVVKGAEKVAVKIGDGEQPAKLVGSDAQNDIAILKVSGTFSPIPLGNVADTTLGESVMTVGYPNIELQGLSPKLTRGEISSLSGIQDDPRLFQISVPVQPGNSGGALVDSSGNAIGITTGQLGAIMALKISGSLPQNVNFAMKISYARLLIETVPHLPQELPPPQHDKLDSRTITEQVTRATVLVLVWKAPERSARAADE